MRAVSRVASVPKTAETKRDATPIPIAQPGVRRETALTSSFSGEDRKKRATSSAVGNGSALERLRAAIPTRRKITDLKYLKAMIARNPPDSFFWLCICLGSAFAILSALVARLPVAGFVI